MNNNSFNQNSSSDSNLNNYNNDGNFNNENNQFNQNYSYSNSNNKTQNFDNNLFSNNNRVNQNSNLVNDNNNVLEQSINEMNNFYDNFGKLNSVDSQNQDFNNSLFDNSGQNSNDVNNSFNQDIEFDNVFSDYSVNDSYKKKTSKSLIIVALSLSTLFWCFVIFLSVFSVSTTVNSTQNYLDEARVGTFVDSAKSALSAVNSDVIINGYRPYYSLDEINNLVERKFTTSPFGSEYKDSSCIKVINDDYDSYNYRLQMCLIDEDGNGFTLTDEDTISNDYVKVGSLKNVECSCN